MIRSIRKPGSPQEAVQAARGIALAFLNQGDTSAGEQEDLFGMVLSLLKNIIAHSLDPQLKYQAKFLFIHDDNDTNNSNKTNLF